MYGNYIQILAVYEANNRMLIPGNTKGNTYIIVEQTSENMQVKETKTLWGALTHPDVVTNTEVYTHQQWDF